MAAQGQAESKSALPAGPAGSNPAGRLGPAAAWTAYRPSPGQPWALGWAGHLLRRAAFGATWQQLQQALADGPQRTVDRLLKPPADLPDFNRTYDRYERSAAVSDSADALRAWWLRRMIETPHPLLEKMTLFWHDYFAVSNVTVGSASLMQQHTALLREHALGRFDKLLPAVCCHPATLAGLGAAANRRARPSALFARRLLERFTVGPGQFSEPDVRDLARAFTGWFVLRGRLRYFTREHDGGQKRILGQTGNFDAEQAVAVLLEQPQTARHVVRRLYRWLISESAPPEDAVVEPLAGEFARHYDIGRLVETMLRSQLFFSPVAWRQRVKSPVEFALGIVVGLEGLVSTQRLGQDLAALGQNLLYPPPAAGWAGGRNWINPAMVVARCNLAAALVSASDRYGDKLNPWSVAGRHGFRKLDAAARFLADLFLQGQLDESVRAAVATEAGQGAGSGPPPQRLRRFAHALFSLPEFQLA